MEITAVFIEQKHLGPITGTLRWYRRTKKNRYEDPKLPHRWHSTKSLRTQQQKKTTRCGLIIAQPMQSIYIDETQYTIEEAPRNDHQKSFAHSFKEKQQGW